VDLIVHLDEEPFDTNNYRHDVYRKREYTREKYLIYIRQRDKLLSEYPKLESQMNYVAQYKIFVWTVSPKIRGVGAVTEFVFSEVFHISEIRDWPSETYQILILENFNNSNSKTEMDTFSTRMMKQYLWMPIPQFSYRKLDRTIKLPFDEKNLNRSLSRDFQEFIISLLTRRNLSGGNMI